jgi:hypothetical protein
VILKRLLVAILNDNEFIKWLLGYYDITILDLFRIITKRYAFMFNSYYSAQLNSLMKRKAYVRVGLDKRPGRR